MKMRNYINYLLFNNHINLYKILIHLTIVILLSVLCFFLEKDIAKQVYMIVSPFLYCLYLNSFSENYLNINDSRFLDFIVVSPIGINNSFLGLYFHSMIMYTLTFLLNIAMSLFMRITNDLLLVGSLFFYILYIYFLLLLAPLVIKFKNHFLSTFFITIPLILIKLDIDIINCIYSMLAFFPFTFIISFHISIKIWKNN